MAMAGPAGRWPAGLFWAAALVAFATGDSNRGDGPIPLFNLGDNFQGNQWVTREMLGGRPEGAFGSAMALFSYSVPQDWSDDHTRSVEGVSVKESVITSAYVYGGITESVNNGSIDLSTTVSDDFHVLKWAPGGGKPSWYSWAPGGSPGPRGLHSMTCLSLAFLTPEEEAWSLDNPHTQVPCDPSATSGPLAACLEHNKTLEYRLMERSILGATLVMFGGLTQSSPGRSASEDDQWVLPNYTAVNTTHIFQFNSTGWRPSQSVANPPARWGHVACRRSFTTLLIFGGSHVVPRRFVATAFYQGPGMPKLPLLNDTWLYDLVSDAWVGPLNLTSPAAASVCGAACAADTAPPPLERALASNSRVGTTWYVYGGMTSGIDNTIDVLWWLNVATIDPTNTRMSPGWQYTRLLGQPAILFALPGQLLTTSGTNWSSLKPIAGGTLFPGNYIADADVRTTELVSCGGFQADAGGMYLDRPFMCMTLNLRNMSFDQSPPAVVSQSWELAPAQMMSVETIVNPRLVVDDATCPVGNTTTDDDDAVLGLNCSVASVTHDVTSVLFGGWSNYATSNSVHQLFQGESLAGRGVMMTTTTQPTPTLKNRLYAQAAMNTVNGSIMLWYLSVNNAGCGLSSCAPTLWHLCPASYYAGFDEEVGASGVAVVNHALQPPVWVDSGPDSTSNFGLPSPVVPAQPYFAAVPGSADQFVLFFAGDTAIELWTYTLITRDCTNTSLTESLFHIFGKAPQDINVSFVTNISCSPVPQFLPGIFAKVGNIFEYNDSSISAYERNFSSVDAVVLPDPVHDGHWCIAILAYLSEWWLLPHDNTTASPEYVAGLRMESALWCSRTRQLYKTPADAPIPSLRSLPILTAVGDTALLVGGVMPPGAAGAIVNGVLLPPSDLVWTARVEATGSGGFSLAWSPVTSVGAVPGVGIWGGSCVIGGVAYFYTEVTMHLSRADSFLYRTPNTLHPMIQRARLVGSTFEWEPPTAVSLSATAGDTHGFAGWADFTELFGYKIGNGSSVLLGTLGGIVLAGEQSDASSLPTVVLSCPPGASSPDYSSEFCSPCPEGTFKSNSGAHACEPCPTGTWTLGSGAQSDYACTACSPNFCNGHGSCSLSGFSPQCSCSWPWHGSQCDVNGGIVALWVVIALVGAAIVTGGLAWWVLRPRKSYHVFISYRVATDAALARRVCRALQGREVEPGVPLHCYLDQKDIESGTDWEKSFMTGLARSCVYLPLVSDGAIAPIEGVSSFDDKEDNLLKEIEFALRLQARGRIGVLPLLVGTVDARTGDYAKFSRFDVERFPKGCSKTDAKRPVRETMRALFKFQGVFSCPDAVDEPACAQIVDFLRLKVWRTSHSGLSLGLRRFWVRDRIGEERSSDRLGRIGTMADLPRPAATLLPSMGSSFSSRRPAPKRVSRANELWDAALTVALVGADGSAADSGSDDGGGGGGGEVP